MPPRDMSPAELAKWGVEAKWAVVGPVHAGAHERKHTPKSVSQIEGELVFAAFGNVGGETGALGVVVLPPE